MSSKTTIRGTQLFIGTTATNATGDTYTEIVGGKAYQGEYGPEAADVDATEIIDLVKQSDKGLADYGDITIGGNYRWDDPGQILLKAAAAPSDQGVYNFKFAHPNGRVAYVKARVFGFRQSMSAEIQQFKSKLSLTAAVVEA